MSFIVAIDGPAGTGKSTITKMVGKILGLAHIDTGAMYRCVTLDCLRNNVSVDYLEGISKILENIDISFKRNEDGQKVFLNKEDVTERIRQKDIDNFVAKYAAIKIIRDKVAPIQRKCGREADSVLEGRDIGTVIFPDADVKIYLDCSVEERAKRRYLQNLEKGINSSYEEVLNSIIERHRLETEREISPLVKADDAVYVDTTTLTIDEVCNKIIDIINEKR